MFTVRTGIADSCRALARLHGEMGLVHTYHSNAIAGNTLTLQETKLVLEEGVTIGGKLFRELKKITYKLTTFWHL